MKLYYPITVDLYQPYPLPIMEAQQNNIGRGALVTLTAQGAVITPTGESIQLYAKKPDGTISYLACTLTGSQIECDFTNQMLALPGMVQVELQMIGGESGAETEITTPIFCVRVNPSNVDDSAVESQDEFPALVTALAELAELKENGLKGDPGEAATIQIGTVTASDPGSNPQVTNSGTEQDAVLNFVLPRGEQGPQGETGPAVSSASDVLYSNASSGLTADNVQAAIDENAEAISGLNSRIGFAEYRNIDLNTVNEYCFVVIDSNSESYNAPAAARYLCTPQAVGFQIGVDMNAGNFYARGHNWGGFSDWRNFSFS